MCLKKRHITYLTLVCLALILNQSVLMRAEGLLINFNCLCVGNVPSRCKHAFIHRQVTESDQSVMTNRASFKVLAARFVGLGCMKKCDLYTAV